MKTSNIIVAALAAFSIGSASLLAGCGDDATTTDMPVQRDLSMPANPGADMTNVVLPPDMGCYGVPPMTQVQIINACTKDTRTTIPKTPTLPLLNPDGTLPPIP